MALLTVLLAALAGLLGAVLLLFSWHFNYWKQRNVPYYNPAALSTLLATRFRSLPLRKPLWLMCEEVYWRFRDRPYAGFFQLSRPALVVRDPELIKLVLTKEFSSFHDRGLPVDEENDPFSVNVSSLEGEKWKNMRSKLTPTFTSGKLKLMFHLMVDVTEELKAMLRKSAERREEVEMRDLLLRYVTDIIGSCAFGVNCNSLRDPKSEFFTMGRAVFDNTFLVILRFVLLWASPIFLRILRFDQLFSKHQTFFANLMKETVQFREKNGIKRNDFVDLMMQLKDSETDDIDPTKHVRFDNQHMAAEAFVFFVAGLDNISNIIGFGLNALAFDEELQRRAAAEVLDKVRKHDGQLTYEAVREMELVERIVLESMRLWGPGALLSRSVTRPFRLPDSDLVLDTTPLVLIPVWQLHHDPAYYPDPERFDPDRFTEEARRARHPYAYLPFGEGPRVCIAQRFAMLEMKLCLASLLHHFHFSPGAGAKRSPELLTGTFSPTPKNGFPLVVRER